MPDLSGLLPWYDVHHRDLPWRRTRDPYAVWVSEAMLQQTRVQTVVPYWGRWMDRLPTVESLAFAEDQDVLALWSGLGYYRRCRSLIAGARLIAQDGMPATFAGWLRIPGVGRYTAAAIASIAFNEPVAVVDGNVERVYARLNEDPAAGSLLNRRARTWATESLDRERPGDWNQALMELGATICRPGTPECPVCPVKATCRAFEHDRVASFPIPTSKPKTIALTHYVVVPYYEGRFGVRQVPEGEWWQGMWEFLRSSDPPASGTWIGRFRHSVTHHRIAVEVYLATPDRPSAALRWLTATELGGVALPSPQRRCLSLALGALGDSCQT